MSKQVVHTGIGPIGLLGVVFVTLKLLKVIDWSWWWVTLPFWGFLAVVLIVFAFVGFIALLEMGGRGR